ncbi:MAG: enoyl-CoA hydratase/isomerase family protein [Rhodospirillales bacterium]|nr:enoyl-CoA hydratase/isomerase family protein [Rhodospirillales bacterium]
MSDVAADIVVYEREDDIGLIRVTNPPVNALSQAVRAGLMAALTAGYADKAAKVLLLYCGGRTFIAGADIGEFGKPPLEPGLGAVIATMDAAPKGIVAAIHGTALGGGLEIALGCHFRVGLPSAEVGLPEVKLGLVPGAGGTQRLPRLIGLEAALDIVVTGRPVPAAEARSLGILDAVIAVPDVKTAGLIFARKVIEEGLPAVRVRDRKPTAAPAGLFEKTRAGLKRRSRGQISPLACADAVEAAAALPFDEGIVRERAIFMDCMASPQRVALVHAFFGERAVGKIPGLAPASAARPLNRAAVIGAGTMGGGIAMCFANAGLPVTLVETTQEALDRGLAKIRGNYEGSAKRGRISRAEVEKRMRLIEPALEPPAIAEADIVIEAVFEKLDVKREVFAMLDRHAKPGAVLATNTSYLDIDKIAGFTDRPGDVLGMHFFSPANVMRLLEIVKAGRTAPDVLKTALQAGKLMGKVPVVAGVCDGFIGNRMLKYYRRQANYMLEDGALPQQIDKAITDFGFAMGPFAVEDLAGIDIGYLNRRREDETRDPNERYVDLADKLYGLGRLGQKTGAGWYRYEQGSRTPLPDPLVEKLILDASAAKGITRREIPDEEIRSRVLCALANEGAKILEEGIAFRPADIDQVWIHGYAFPAHRGGPMFWADALGLDKVVATMADGVRKWAQNWAQNWQPAPLLARLAAEGSSFAAWSEARGG